MFLLHAVQQGIASVRRRRFPFEVGTCGRLWVRPESVVLGLPQPMRLLYASDLHLGHGWTRTVPDQLVAAAEQTQPDVILLGGDLADHGRALDALTSLVRRLSQTAPVHAVPGNHDERAGVAQVRSAVIAAGGNWLPDRSGLHGANQQLLTIEGLLDERPSPGPRVLCAHYPSVFPAAVAAGYRLVLAGHLHGGQCVLATRGQRLYPAVWFHRWHGLRFEEPGATLLVSRGVADTLPLRFNCPREVILCMLE